MDIRVVGRALWVPPHDANIELPKTCFWGEGGHSNKKRKTGKNANAEEKEETGNSSVPPPKTELSEDELQSDFSDDEGDVKPRKGSSSSIHPFLFNPEQNHHHYLKSPSPHWIGGSLQRAVQ
jgi:hypothetical protein